jgi:CspA family cold shock protein
MSFISHLKNLLGLGTKPKSGTEKKYGVVNYYNRRKGYGFIQVDGMEDRVFMHISNADDKIKVGSAVSFLMGKNRKGYFAEDIELVK